MAQSGANAVITATNSDGTSSSASVTAGGFLTAGTGLEINENVISLSNDAVADFIEALPQTNLATRSYVDYSIDHAIPNYVAGGGINITDNVISIDPAVVGNGEGTTYTAGNGIAIANDEISIDTTVVATKSDLETLEFLPGPQGETGPQGPQGPSGVSPTATVSKNGDNTLITITDANGTTTATIVDNPGYTAGTNITIDANNVISATGGGSTYTAGTGIDITNDEISVDTITVAMKADIPDTTGFVEASALATVATTGDYTDLSNKPTIPTVPTNVSDFTNDAGYLTSFTEADPVFTASAAYGITASDITAWNGKSNFSGSYNDLTDKPTIPTVPTAVSSFTNDAGYITGSDLPNDELPTIDTGDAGKVLKVNSEETGVEWGTVASGATYTAGIGISIDGNNAISADVFDIGNANGSP